MNEFADLVIIGGGASGQAAAIAAAGRGYTGRILILEKEKKCGRKILASGNGRCNLSHKPINVTDYRSHDPSHLEKIIRHIPEDTDLRFFKYCGIPVKEDEQGRMYPLSEEALSVQSMLSARLRMLGVDIQVEAEAEGISSLQNGLRVKLRNGHHVNCRELIIAGGGSAAPHLGGSGSAIQLCRSLGLKIYSEVPALSAWISDEKALCRPASGARFKGSAQLGDHTVKGEFLFADDGISGIAAMEMGLELSRSSGSLTGRGKEQIYRFAKPVTVEVDLVSPMEREELVEYLKSCSRNGGNWRDWLCGCVHSRIIAGISNARGALLDRLSATSCGDMARYLKQFPLKIDGLRGFHGAQTSFGGVALSEVDENFKLVSEPRISLCGEVLDISGNTGGYNLYFAFVSGVLAGLGRLK